METLTWETLFSAPSLPPLILHPHSFVLCHSVFWFKLIKDSCCSLLEWNSGSMPSVWAASPVSSTMSLRNYTKRKKETESRWNGKSDISSICAEVCEGCPIGWKRREFTYSAVSGKSMFSPPPLCPSLKRNLWESLQWDCKLSNATHVCPTLLYSASYGKV